MPTYNSLGISASLLVTELDKTLSQEIVFRMGSQQQGAAKRIAKHLHNGRALHEQPIVCDDPKVGIFQFVGRDQDMALLLVEASERRTEQDSSMGDSGIGERLGIADTGLLTTNNNITTSHRSRIPIATNRSMSKRSASSDQDDNENTTKRRKHSLTTGTSISAQIADSTPSSNPTRPDALPYIDLEPLALSLKLDFTKFYEIDKQDKQNLQPLSGKELKIEVFINGQLQEVGFETSRAWKREAIVHFSGRRFHRQAEKPWVYVPSAPGNGSDVCPRRWSSINGSLANEAGLRGLNEWNQRPITGQYLAALARLQLPQGCKAENQNFAIVDLVITAGKGGKFGPDTTYLTEPARLADKSYSGVAPVSDDSLSRSAEDNNVHNNAAIDTFGDLLDYAGPQLPELGMSQVSLEQQPLHTFANPQTPQSTLRTVDKYHAIVGAMPFVQKISTYENARGQLKGKRTLSQRLGDMAKMSPKKQQETLNNMRQELDEDTILAIMAAFNIDAPWLATSDQKQVQVCEDTLNLLRVTCDEPQSPTAALSARSMDRTLPQINPSWLEEEFGTDLDLMSRQTTTFDFDSEARGLDLDLLAISPDLTLPTLVFEETAASALDNSVTAASKDSHPAHHNDRAETQPVDSFNDEVLELRTPVRDILQPTTAQRSGATRTAKTGLPAEQIFKQALTEFEVPEVFAGSTVAFADGDKQRQVGKTRGGVFEEQHFVVGMRFIVL